MQLANEDRGGIASVPGHQAYKHLQWRHEQPSPDAGPQLQGRALELDSSGGVCVITHFSDHSKGSSNPAGPLSSVILGIIAQFPSLSSHFACTELSESNVFCFK